MQPPPRADVVHYASHVLIDIYPLTKTEYTSQSMPRRASYDYLNQTVEAGHRLAANLIQHTGAAPESTYYRRFSQARDLAVFPDCVTATMLSFQSLRNKTVHENWRVNQNVSLYPRLLELSAVGFALYELTRFHQFRDPKRVVIIDTDYLLAWLRGPINFTHHAPSEELKTKVIDMLKREAHPPRYEIRRNPHNVA